MFRILAACLIAFAAVGLSQPAHAQQTAESLPPLTPEHLELARQVFVASNTGRSFDEILPTVADRAKSTFIRANPQIQLGVIEAVDRVALDMVKNRQDLDQGLVRVWARAFDPAELTAILEFYQSPAGQKFAENYPKVISTQLAVADNWTKEIGGIMARRVREELRKMVSQDVKELRGTNTDSQGQ